MNHVTGDAPRSQKDIENCDYHRCACRITYRKQWRVNPDVVRSIYERHSRNVECASVCAFDVTVTPVEQLFYSDRYRGDTKQSKPLMSQNLSNEIADSSYESHFGKH